MNIIIVGTSNSTKTEQIRAGFEGSSYQIKSLVEAGIEGKLPDEGETLYARALAKAEFASRRALLWPAAWYMGEATGLFIPALGNAPGVEAATWAGKDATPEQVVRHTLKQLEGVADRTASFRTSVVLISPEGDPFHFKGEMKGRILEAERVPPQAMMPYSGIFLPDGQTEVPAQMKPEDENKFSNRGLAVAQARLFLEPRG